MAKCKYCGNKYEQRFNSFEDACYLPSCQLKSKQDKIDKQKAKQALKTPNLKLKSIQKTSYRIPKTSKSDSLQSLENQAKAVFQKWIRIRDKDLPCISCGSTFYVMQAGHYFPAGVWSGLIFNEINTNSQCRTCNIMLNGNPKGYKDGLFKKYGEVEVIKLIQSADANRNYKYTRNELIAKRLQYEIKIKELENKN